MRRDVAMAGLGFWLLVSAFLALIGGRARADRRTGGRRRSRRRRRAAGPTAPTAGGGSDGPPPTLGAVSRGRWCSATC